MGGDGAGGGDQDTKVGLFTTKDIRPRALGLHNLLSDRERP